MRNWITADPDYITSDLLMEVSDIAREPVADRSLPTAFLAEGRHLVKSPLLTVSLACIAACALLLGRKRVLAAVVLSLGGAFAACVLFRYTAVCQLVSSIPRGFFLCCHVSSRFSPLDPPRLSQLSL